MGVVGKVVDLVACGVEIGPYALDDLDDAAVLDVDGREDFGVESLGWGNVDGAAEEDVAGGGGGLHAVGWWGEGVGCVGRGDDKGE